MKTINKKIFLLVACVAILVWVSDAAIDAFIFRHGTFRDMVWFAVSNHELYFRLFFIAVYSLLSYALVRIFTKQRQVKESMAKHLTAIENSMDGIAILDPNHVYLYANEAYARITGFTNPATMQGKSFDLIYDEKQIAWISQNVFPVLEREGRWHGELLAHRKDGTTFEQDASITRLADNSCVCVMRDVSERKRKEHELQRSEKFLNSIFESIRDPFCIIDRNFTIVRANAAYARLKSKAVGDLIDRTCFEVLQGSNEVCDGCVIKKTMQSADSCAKEKKVNLKNGDSTWVEIYTYPLLDESGQLSHVIEYARDVTDRKKAEEDRRTLIDRLKYLSQVDGLTGLLNRRAISEQLEYEIGRAKRYGSDLSLILCDLDNLKEINDTYGHLAGDTTLQLVSASLRNSLRNADIAGRYGGDEFLVIVPQTAVTGVTNIAEKILNAVQKTEVRIDDHQSISISLSIGVASLKSPSETIDTFVSRVDAALYDSKKSGRNRLTVAS